MANDKQLTITVKVDDVETKYLLERWKLVKLQEWLKENGEFVDEDTLIADTDIDD